MTEPGTADDTSTTVASPWGGSLAKPGHFAVGDSVLLVDRKRRRYLIRLEAGGTFHSHLGTLAHDELIGAAEGSLARTARGSRLLALRPTLADRVLEMPRGAQVIYPKDLGPILMLLDVHPGTTVLESGLGSGATTMALLGVGAQVVGYEVRKDFAERAAQNVADALGDDQPLSVHVADVTEGVSESGLDRAMLDLPEPERALPAVARALRPGGIVVSYVPTVLQLGALHEGLARSGFGLARTIEVLERSWHVDGRSIRPDHRMVAHTGFLTQARRLDAEGEWTYSTS